MCPSPPLRQTDPTEVGAFNNSTFFTSFSAIQKYFFMGKRSHFSVNKSRMYNLKQRKKQKALSFSLVFPPITPTPSPPLRNFWMHPLSVYFTGLMVRGHFGGTGSHHPDSTTASTWTPMREHTNSHFLTNTNLHFLTSTLTYTSSRAR